MDEFISKIINNPDDLFIKYSDHISNNEIYYNKLKNKIKANINGRICHHRIKILHSIFYNSDYKSYLEIGVHNGSSMSYVVTNDKPIKCYGIDLFDDTYGHYLKEDKIRLERTTLNISKNNLKSKVKLIKGNSTNNDTINELKKQLRGNKIDVLFIDGDHSYEGVKKDFINYSDFVRSNGLIILDDFDPTYKTYPEIRQFAFEMFRNNLKYKILGVFGNNELLILKI